MNDLEKQLRAAIGTGASELEKQLRKALEGQVDAAPGGAMSTAAGVASGPSYGLNSTELNQSLAARLGPGTTIDADLNNN